MTDNILENHERTTKRRWWVAYRPNADFLDWYCVNYTLVDDKVIEQAFLTTSGRWQPYEEFETIAPALTISGAFMNVICNVENMVDRPKIEDYLVNKFTEWLTLLGNADRG